MATVAFFHAHPDDESIATGGTMARLTAEGHRVVLVHATMGDKGEVPDGFLDPGETLAERRTREVDAAARAVGVARAEFLGYGDSGMAGTADNDDPRCFWQADVDTAATKLAQLLEEENVDVLVTYDEKGQYGHPDHIQVHRVGVRAAELAGTGRVYENTVDQDAIKAMIEANSADIPDEEMPPVEDFSTLGMPGHLITTRVDVSDYLVQKRAAMAAHASQISETSFFLAQPGDRFREMWGTEWYIRRGAPAGTVESSLVDGL